MTIGTLNSCVKTVNCHLLYFFAVILPWFFSDFGWRFFQKHAVILAIFCRDFLLSLDMSNGKLNSIERQLTMFAIEAVNLLC